MSHPTSPSGFNKDPADVYDMINKIVALKEERRRLRSMLSECVIDFAGYEARVRERGMSDIADDLNKSRVVILDFMDETREKYGSV